MKMSLTVLVVLGLGPGAFCQTGGQPAIEGFGGWAGFIDSPVIDHSAFGGSGRYYVTPSIGIGPEVAYMSGPGSDRDLILTGNVTFDLLPPTGPGSPRVTPFLVAGGGLFRHTDGSPSREFSSTEGAFTAGGGLRIWLNGRIYIAPDFRLGWELHARATLGVGVRFGR